MEPIIKEPTSEELEEIFLWYTKNVADHERFVEEYLLSTRGVKYNVPHSISRVFAYCCRILSNDSYLPYNNLQWFLKTLPVIEESLKPNIPRPPKPRKGISEKVDEIKFMIEDFLSEHIESNFSNKISFKSIFNNLKGIHAKLLLEHLKGKVIEFQDILVSKDKDVMEAYSYISKGDVRKIIKIYEDLQKTCEGILSMSRMQRKPRKKKIKPLTVKYCISHPTLNIQGLSADDIINAHRVIVFDIKYRKLGCYYSDSGMTIKGTTIYNFNPDRSTQKILRKPDILLTGISNGGIIEFNKTYPKIKTAAQRLTGRLNDNTLILYGGE